ncbi:MAG TPA: phosphatase PAP2 family protein [Kofleriaceae bacterium]
MRRRWWPPAIGLAYIALIAQLGGLGGQHIMMGMLGFLDAYNEKTRLFLKTFLAFMVTGILYDSLRYLLPWGIEGHIHVTGPYLFDRTLFNIGGLTPNEFFAIHHWTFADVITGFSYLAYVAEYLGLGMVLFFTGHIERAALFSLGFLCVNLLGFATYFIYPAAPPWYVTAHGLGPAQTNVAPDAAGAVRFDEILGTHLFQDAYSHSVEVFGAIPSLHVAYPLMAAILAFRLKELRWARWPTAIYAPVMCFSAVYLQHHYILDVLVGLTFATIVALSLLAWDRRRAAAV